MHKKKWFGEQESCNSKVNVGHIMDNEYIPYNYLLLVVVISTGLLVGQPTNYN